METSVQITSARHPMTQAIWDRCWNAAKSADFQNLVPVILAIIRARLGQIVERRKANSAVKAVACSAAWVVIKADAAGYKVTGGDVRQVMEILSAKSPDKYTCHTSGLRGLQLPVDPPEGSAHKAKDCQWFIAERKFMDARKVKGTAAQVTGTVAENDPELAFFSPAPEPDGA